MQFLAQLINGCVDAALLFLLASGLALVFGLLKVINLAHGSFFMLGAFCGLSTLRETGSFTAAILIAPLAVGCAAAVVELILLRRIYHRSPFDQVLLTFGLSFVATDVVETVWGKELFAVPEPRLLAYSVGHSAIIVPAYRLFLIAVGVIWAAILWILIEKTRLGARLRAGLDDGNTAVALGINVPQLRTLTFSVGAAGAAFAGIIAAPVLGVSSNLDVEVLVPALLVVALGGLGSLRGTALASVVIGMGDTLGRAYAPGLAAFVVDLLVMIALLMQPGGLGALGLGSRR